MEAERAYGFFLKLVKPLIDRHGTPSELWENRYEGARKEFSMEVLSEYSTNFVLRKTCKARCAVRL